MRKGSDGAVARQLRTLFNVGSIGELTDGQLLERFAVAGGEVAELAFAVLVERHGPMVLRVCRGVLADHDDIQDAFQATFLVLVKNARGLWVRDSLGPWLHQVAYRTACCARATVARRRRHERHAATARSESRCDERDELERVLHEEIERLPERYRAPVVLCDLEGHTHEQAARHLGWPVGTVKSRQSRGRNRLRERLTRRGLAPDAGLLAAALRPEGANALLPPALVDSTIRAAARCGAIQSLVSSSAGSLAQGVLRSMSMTRWLKAASVLLALGAAASGAPLLLQKGPQDAAPRTEAKPELRNFDDLPVTTVKPGDLRVSIEARGNLESSRSDDAYCQVEGITTILAILPEGTKVKKGDRVCELDSSKLRDVLTNQTIVVKAAEAAYANARLAREVAEIAVREYTDGVLPQERKVLDAEITAAGTAVGQAKKRLERSRRAHERLDQALAAKAEPRKPSEITAELEIDDRIDAAERTLERKQMALEIAQSKRQLLERYTSAKIIKQLQFEFERKQTEERATQSTWELEKAKEQKLVRQIAYCKISAPRDGLIVHANDPYRRPGAPPQIQEGASVRERQKIFSVPDISRMQVRARVPESTIDKVVPSMRARITVDAMPDQSFDGTVVDVAPLPDPVYFGYDQKVYTTHVRIQDPAAWLRPGMTATVELRVDERANVLSVPVQAVIRLDGKDRVAVKRSAGVFEWREVTVGASNGKITEIKQGLHRGEQVILSPTALLSEEQKRARPTEPAKPAAKKGASPHRPDRDAPKPER